MAGKHVEKTVRQLRLDMEYKDENLSYQRLAFGHPNKEKRTKTILLIGATGEGKSTMINAMANFLMGVKYGDDHRYRLVDEGQNADQTVSQTTWVTTYVLYHQTSFPEAFNCNLRIIDTPGFGDTRGMAVDQQTTSRLKDLFGMDGDEGIEVVDMVGFVIRASHTRLTEGLKYVFHSILSIFGNDVKKNIFILTTWSDGRKPAVLSALKKEEVPYKVVYRFENGVLFPDGDDDDDDDEDEADSHIAQKSWDKNIRHFEKLLLHIREIMPVSLKLTREVLMERQQLEYQLEAMQMKLIEKLELIRVQESQRAAWQRYQKTMGANKGFTNTIIKTKIVREPNEGTRSLNCDNCQTTCHWPCIVPINALAGTCHIFSMRKCVTCKCSPSAHNVYDYRLKTVSYPVETTMAEMKAEYERASKGAESASNEFLRAEKNIQSTKAVMEEMLKQASESMNRLNRISLKPQVMSKSDYINWLIATEKSNKTPGWEERLKELQAMHDQARCKSGWRRDARDGTRK